MGAQFPDLNREIMAKTRISDSVFTNLFRDPEYTIQLYRALHPEDTTSTKDDVKIVTLENVLLRQTYNDLGFIVGDRLMIFVEAQSTWSDNIVVRSLLYMAQTLQEYIMQSEQYIYGTKRVRFPRPELYVLYTGNRRTRPDRLTLSEVFFGGEPCDIDVTVHMLYDGRQGDIINQYVTFLKVCFEQFKIYGRNQKAVLEAIRICKDDNILRKYLMSREKEVVNIMMLLYDQEYIFNGFVKEQREIGREEGLAAGRAEERAKAEAKIKEEREKAKAAEEKAKADSERQFKNTARTLQAIGLPIEQIAAAVNRSVDTVNQWLSPASMDSFPKA